MTIKTFVADDHPVIRLGVRTALQRSPRARFCVTAEAHNGEQLLALLAHTPCDLLITDYWMPEPRRNDGLTLLNQVRRNYPRLPVLVLTTLDNPMGLRAILNTGVRGLYDKQECLSNLSPAVCSLMRGHQYLSPRFAKRLEEYEADHWGGNERLSGRELQVLKMLVTGMSGREVAARLNRSEKTISRQKRCAMDKLGISHDTALLEYAALIGLPA